MLLVGDDWADDHHDVELMDEAPVPPAPRGLAGLPPVLPLVGTPAQADSAIRGAG